MPVSAPAVLPTAAPAPAPITANVPPATATITIARTPPSQDASGSRPSRTSAEHPVATAAITAPISATAAAFAARTRPRRGSSRNVVCTVPWLHSPAVDSTPRDRSTRAESNPVTTSGPSTLASGSLAAPEAIAIAAGPSRVAATATASPDRVDRDLRTSRPTALGSDGPVRRAVGRTWTGEATAAVMSKNLQKSRGSGRGEGEEDVFQAALQRPEFGEHVTTGRRDGADVTRGGARHDQRAVVAGRDGVALGHQIGGQRRRI